MPSDISTEETGKAVTYHRLLSEGKTMLLESGIREAGAEAFLALEHVTGLDRTGYLLHAPEQVPPEQVRAFLELVRERCARIPMQYLTGRAFFDGLLLHVSEDVLIPRLDTECLTLRAKEYLEHRTARAAGEEAVRVLDLCTGSGCIALAVKNAFPGVLCDASDCSEKALGIARKNAEKLALAVRFFQGDLMEPFRPEKDRFDLILSNPPYIPTGVIGTLDLEVRDHEPRLALDGGEDGLAFYRRIAREVPAFLKPGGALMLEIGYDQGDSVRELLQEQGLENVSVEKDLAGLSRVVTAVRTAE